jgi:hypothetical protein
MLETAKGLTHRLKKCEFSRQAYLADLKALNANFVRDFVALTESWKCAKCGEENPSSFESCWNCRSKEADPIQVSDDAKPFPSVPPGGNPWET